MGKQVQSECVMLLQCIFKMLGWICYWALVKHSVFPYMRMLEKTLKILGDGWSEFDNAKAGGVAGFRVRSRRLAACSAFKGSPVKPSSYFCWCNNSYTYFVQLWRKLFASHQTFTGSLNRALETWVCRRNKVFMGNVNWSKEDSKPDSKPKACLSTVLGRGVFGCLLDTMF